MNEEKCPICENNEPHWHSGVGFKMTSPPPEEGKKCKFCNWRMDVKNPECGHSIVSEEEKQGASASEPVVSDVDAGYRLGFKEGSARAIEATKEEIFKKMEHYTIIAKETNRTATFTTAQFKSLFDSTNPKETKDNE